MFHTIAHSLDHRLLPTHRFVSLAYGRYNLYIGDDLGEGRYRDVIVREFAPTARRRPSPPLRHVRETGGKRILN